MNPRFLQLSIASSLVALTACGGGGSDNGSSTSAANATTSNAPAASDLTAVAAKTFPKAAPSVGDYFVYTARSKTTVPIPVGTGEYEQTVTWFYTKVNPDGSYEVAETASGNTNGLAFRTFAPDGGLLTWSNISSSCQYASSFRDAPPFTAIVGDVYAATTTNACTPKPFGAVTLGTFNVTGQVLAAEDQTLPIGTFSTFKYIRNSNNVYSASSGTFVDTCWTDVVTGRSVKCESSITTVPTGQTNPNFVSTSTRSLEAYFVKDRAPVGSIGRRFAGYWDVTFAGTSTGSCANLVVYNDGMIAATCQFRSLTGVLGATFSANGNVDPAGVVSLLASTGATMSGTMTSPLAGSGTWVKGSESGTWTAVHK